MLQLVLGCGVGKTGNDMFITHTGLLTALSGSTIIKEQQNRIQPGFQVAATLDKVPLLRVVDTLLSHSLAMQDVRNSVTECWGASFGGIFSTSSSIPGAFRRSEPSSRIAGCTRVSRGLDRAVTTDAEPVPGPLSAFATPS